MRPVKLLSRPAGDLLQCWQLRLQGNVTYPSSRRFRLFVPTLPWLEKITWPREFFPVPSRFSPAPGCCSGPSGWVSWQYCAAWSRVTRSALEAAPGEDQQQEALFPGLTRGYYVSVLPEVSWGKQWECWQTFGNGVRCEAEAKGQNTFDIPAHDEQQQARDTTAHTQTTSGY